jgi:hypothetical protein
MFLGLMNFIMVGILIKKASAGPGLSEFKVFGEQK